MTILRTLTLAGLMAATLGTGAAMAQANNDAGQLYWSEKALQAAPSVGPVQGQTHSFFYRSDTTHRGTYHGTPDFPSVGGGEG